MDIQLQQDQRLRHWQVRFSAGSRFRRCTFVGVQREASRSSPDWHRPSQQRRTARSRHSVRTTESDGCRSGKRIKNPLYTTAAQQDLAGILRYISRDKPEAIVAWVAKIEEKRLLIASQPVMGERRPQLGCEVCATSLDVTSFFVANTTTRWKFCE